MSTYGISNERLAELITKARAVLERTRHALSEETIAFMEDDLFALLELQERRKAEGGDL